MSLETGLLFSSVSDLSRPTPSARVQYQAGLFVWFVSLFFVLRFASDYRIVYFDTCRTPIPGMLFCRTTRFSLHPLTMPFFFNVDVSCGSIWFCVYQNRIETRFTTYPITLRSYSTEGALRCVSPEPCLLNDRGRY